MRPVRLAACAALLVLLVSACTSDDASSPEQGSETTTTAAPAADSLNLSLVDCPRFGTGTSVDPSTAGLSMTEGVEPLANPDGTALFALQVLECADLVTDGESHGPGRFATAWIKVSDTAELPDLPTSSQLTPSPGDAYEVVLFQTDNEAFQAAAAAFGIPITLADSMSFGPPGPGTQSGAVTDSQYEPTLSYSWTVDNVNQIDREVSAAFHTLTGPDRDGEPLTYFGEFTQGGGWAGNAGAVTLEPGSAFTDLLGDGFTGPVNGIPVTVRMTVYRDVA